MILGVCSHSPLDVVSILADLDITINNQKKSDICIVFQEVKSESKITLVFNSNEYIQKRNIEIIDNNIGSLREVIKEKLKCI